MNIAQPDQHQQHQPKPDDLVNPKSRSRSTTAMSTKGRKRQMSRGSTTSIQSAATHPIHEQTMSPTEYPGPRQWFESEHQHRFEEGDHMGADDMAAPSASQLDGRDYGIDPALGAAVNHSIAYSNDGTYRADGPRPSIPREGFEGSFLDGNSPMLEGRSSEEQDEMALVAEANGAPKKAVKSSAANELEMRQLFNNNKHRTLPEVATELHGNERGPQSERTRQVFAMLWINQVCDKGKGSVPRGRVYANYVSRCATERVTVLNPASFGKLVRVLFPGLKTRRLGVRGESKYHYVNFSLKEDQPNLVENASIVKYEKLKNGDTKVSPPQQPSQEPTDRETFPSANMQQAPTMPSTQGGLNISRARSLYNDPGVHKVEDLESNSKIPQHLKFAAITDNSMQEYEPITLPSIEPYIAIGTDPDSATALTALYRSHCTSLVDAIRFVKQKTFFHLFTSFHGTLTMPVQKLFAHPGIAPWVEECDFVMYQKMIRLLSHLTLEVVPQQVLDTLLAISDRLVSHIKTSFAGHPAHIINAKVKPATLFAGLLDRMYRVNLTAHAAANMLSHTPNRDLMYLDWISMVRLRKVAEGIPTRAMDEVVNLLLTELRDLLDPESVPWEVESTTPYGDIVARNVNNGRRSSIHMDNSTENVLDRWVGFLTSLPGRFPYAGPADIIWCVERVGTAVMQDITIKSGASFGSWWVTKCWIDEMISFMAEKGGFMEYREAMRPRSIVPQNIPQRTVVGNSSAAFGNNNMARQQQYQNGAMNNNDTMTSGVPMDAISQAAMNAAAGHDDSGIGMRTPDDDYSMSKFNFSDAQMGTPNLDLSQGA